MDMNLIFKEADKEDREDCGREPIPPVLSERSESGYKGVHRTGISKWQFADIVGDGAPAALRGSCRQRRRAT